MLLKFKLKLYFILFLFLFLTSPLGAEIAPVVSVRIGKALRNINVSGLDLKRHLIFKNDFKKYFGKKTVKFNCETFGSLNRERNRPILLATLESPTGLLSYENTKYRGIFKVITNARGDSCDIINEIPMESYLSSLLTKEMNPTWPLEALKAQAVAARSYALHKIQSQQVSKELGSEAYYDIESSEKHQVGGAFFDATSMTIKATKETKGEVLATLNGNIRPIFFHAKCGGKTLRPDQVWNNHEPSYFSVNCPFCYSKGPKSWSHQISYQRMKEFIYWLNNEKKQKGKIEQDFYSITMVPDNIDKNSLNFYINGKPYIVEKVFMRKYFGKVIFPSNSFSLEIKNGSFFAYGEGLGHGVGLCQVGALALAQRGWSYKKILSHYFPGHVLKKVY